MNKGVLLIGLAAVIGFFALKKNVSGGNDAEPAPWISGTVVPRLPNEPYSNWPQNI